MVLFRVSQRFDQKQREPRLRKSLLARLVADAVGKKIFLFAHNINQTERNVVDIKPPTDDEDARPLF